MKDPMTQDVALAAIKGTPAIIATVMVRHGIDWYGLVSATTVIYTVVMTVVTIIRNWKAIIQWSMDRLSTLRACWSWLRGRR